MVFFFVQVLVEQFAELIEKRQYLRIAHAFDQRLDQGVVGKLLQVVDQGAFVRRAIEAEPDEAVEAFDKKMGVFGHLWYGFLPCGAAGRLHEALRFGPDGVPT